MVAEETLAYSICLRVDIYRLLQNIKFLLVNISGTFSTIIDYIIISTFLVDERKSRLIL